MNENYYDLLRVSQGASVADIRAAYRREAMKWHPDRNGGSPAAAERFKHIQWAFSVLSNERSRAVYDATLRQLHPNSAERRAYDDYWKAKDYWAEREWGSDINNNQSWSTLFRGRGMGIGGILFLVWMVVQVLHWIIPNGL